VFKSTDGGTSWSGKTAGLTNANVQGLAIDPSRPTTVYAATTSGVFKSADGGGEWRPLDAGLTDVFVFTVAVDSTRAYAGTFGHGVFDLDQPSCGDRTVACVPARSASLHIVDRADDRGGLFRWKWAGDATVAAGRPGADDVTLCMTDATSAVILRATAPAGGVCAGRPCWSGTTRRSKYSDEQLTPDGLRRIEMKGRRRGKARIAVKGRGARLELGTLPFGTPVTVRLQRAGDGKCWEATFAAPDRNDRVRFDAELD